MESNEYITVQEATREIDRGAIFSFTVVTFDLQRQRGGELMSFPEAKKYIREARPQTNKEAKRSRIPRKFIRPVIIYQDGEETSVIKSIHPPLLTEFNGKKVIP